MTPYDAFSLFQERRLSGDECAEVFAIDIARLGKHCGITDDTALACKFVSGLPIDVRKEVMLRMGRKPMLSAAVEASQVLLGGITKDNVETNDGFVGQVSGGCSGNQRVCRCFKCGGSNHLAPQCRTIICYGCGKFGHREHGYVQTARRRETNKGRLGHRSLWTVFPKNSKVANFCC